MKDPNFFLEGLIKNDEKVVKDIYNNSFYKVLSFISKNKGSRLDAEDVFQNALLQLAVRYKKEKFQINTNFEAYLFTVCKNLWRRELNKSKLKVTNDYVIELRDDNEDIALSVLEQQRWELFNDYIQQLSENCIKIMSMFFKRKSYAEMVNIFEYSSETVVRQRVFKCKAKLKEMIKSDSRFKSLLEL
ncbi:RNA polymerase sigma factor [Psychroserpens algicola]|uniref:Sigma-70 family RNA polymerase sigma factor n=1 Tax=Psychroserpens algicola TaxID=1719034 RepID=A0ABT0H6T5_9FLAO|nr:sigma-70 family RNA polymerase sigma factor [Psychroserpens algicola]MCK8480083.1 sigma-70 family RNA polymerase sigma factor [Psychroserpens algicola]